MSETLEEVVPKTTEEQVSVPQENQDEIVSNLDLSQVPEEVIPPVEEVVIYTQHEIEAITQLTEAGGYILDNNKLVLLSPVKEFPTPEEISTLATTIKQEAREKELQTQLMLLCSNLFTKMKQFLSSKYVTPDQQERYNIKAQAAKNNQVEYFVDEATLLGLEPETLMKMVLEISKQWEQSINTAAVKIDAVRVYLSSLISTDSEFVAYAIEYFNNDFSNLSLETPILDTVNKLKDSYKSSLTQE